MYNIIEIYWEIFGRNDLQRAHCSIYFSQLWWYKNVPILSPSSHRLHLNHQEPSGLVTRHLTRKIKEQFVFNFRTQAFLQTHSRLQKHSFKRVYHTQKDIRSANSV